MVSRAGAFVRSKGMTTSTKVLALVALLAWGTGCTSTSISGPADPDQVVLDVRVTGGIAGVDYRIRIDGTDREVDVTCASGCFSSYQPFLALTSAQWTDLLDEVFRAGIPDMGSRDWGGSCCDFFFVEIGYRDGERRANVSGDDTTFPPAVAALARRLIQLNEGIVPALVRPGVAVGTGPAAPLDLDDLRLDGLRLEASVSYSGGCARHAMDLVFNDAWMESHPVQTRAWLTHHDPGDPCDARPHEMRRFDLAPLVEAYRAAYPGAGAGTTIIVHVVAPATGDTRTVEVVLP